MCGKVWSICFEWFKKLTKILGKERRKNRDGEDINLTEGKMNEWKRERRGSVWGRWDWEIIFWKGVLRISNLGDQQKKQKKEK